MTSSLTPEEEKLLQKELPQTLNENGVNNKSKAQYVKMISDEVLGSTNPNFFSMQPKIKDHSNNEAWNAAYFMVRNLLKDNELSYTLETLNKEMKLKNIQDPPLPTIPSHIQADNLESFFNLDVTFEVAVTDVFKEKVETFLKEHPELAPHTLAEPLSSNSAAFLTAPNLQHVENDNENEEEQQFNSDDEKLDINDFTDDEEVNDKQNSDEEVKDDFVVDEVNNEAGTPTQEDHSESFNISENFEVNFDSDD